MIIILIIQSQKRIQENMNSDLKIAIEKLTEKVSLSDLTKARDALTMKYRNPLRFGKTQNLMTSELERLSYLVTRMPATYAVIEDILEKVKQRLEDLIEGTRILILASHDE